MVQHLELMTPDEVMEKLEFPSGLRAETIDIGRNAQPRLHKAEDGYLLRFGNKMEFPLDRQDAINSIYDITGVPKWHARNTPDRLIAPMLEYHLGQQEKVLAVADDQGLQRLVSTREMQPAFPAERTMEEILKRFPETLFQRVHTDGQSADLLAITHNDEKRLEELLQPNLHQFLPDGGDAFRAGIHLRFSPLGIVEPRIEPYVVRLVCRNGAIHQEYLSAWGRGYGEGDEVWNWFRQGMDHAARSIDGVLGKYSDMVGEEIAEGEERVLALEGMIRAARLPRHMADPMRDAAIAHPPGNMYDLYNLLTYVSTHNARDFGEQIQAMQRAGEQAEPGHHARYCPTCRRN